MSNIVVEATGVNLRLMSGKEPLHILRDVDLTVEAGEVVAVVGPSGSGKTSLLMVLAGLEKATGGTVRIAGQDITHLDEDGLAEFRRRNVGIIFQNFHLIPSLTALENVMLALEIAEMGMTSAEMRTAAIAALEQVGLGGRLNHLPSTLSGGEQQRVALARSMVTKPPLLFADEPTGNLDQDSGARVIEMMFDLARRNHTAVFLITHDRALAERADRRLYMNRGHLGAEGEAAAE